MDEEDVLGRVVTPGVSGNRITTEMIGCESLVLLFNGVSGCAFGLIQRNILTKWTR